MPSVGGLRGVPGGHLERLLNGPAVYAHRVKPWGGGTLFVNTRQRVVLLTLATGENLAAVSRR